MHPTHTHYVHEIFAPHRICIVHADRVHSTETLTLTDFGRGDGGDDCIVPAADNLCRKLLCRRDRVEVGKKYRQQLTINF